jgi:hypothetical protein
MEKSYISRNYKHITSAGGKAKTDIELIISKLGVKNIALKQTQHKNKFLDYFLNLIGILKSLFCMPTEGVIFLQYPMKKYYSLICKTAHFKKTKVITFIHDLGSFRRKKLSVQKEIKRLNGSDYIIAPNEVMGRWLSDNQYKGDLGVLEIFDYLSDCENITGEYEERPQIFTVNYAGSLTKRKNAFLYEMGPYINSFIFQLYGNGYTRLFKIPKFIYKGFESSDNFIRQSMGDFGLVWDGDSLDTCSGDFGIYLKYNTPHKISFYVRAHLPIIIWKDAAMASFIEREGIGFTISSLKELDHILQELPIEEYNKMKKKTIDLSKKLKEGDFMMKAAKNAINHFER